MNVYIDYRGAQHQEHVVIDVAGAGEIALSPAKAENLAALLVEAARQARADGTAACLNCGHALSAADSRCFACGHRNCAEAVARGRAIEAIGESCQSDPDLTGDENAQCRC